MSGKPAKKEGTRRVLWISERLDNMYDAYNMKGLNMMDKLETIADRYNVLINMEWSRQIPSETMRKAFQHRDKFKEALKGTRANEQVLALGDIFYAYMRDRDTHEGEVMKRMLDELTDRQICYLLEVLGI